MRALVTGAAGFIGSTLCDRLLDEGWDVLGVDCFTPYYDRAAKESNLEPARDRAGFELLEVDLLSADTTALMSGVDVVFHLAAQPGVRLSWEQGFSQYVALNIELTQRLLESARVAAPGRFVYASSSSVYGNAARVPTDETEPTRPFSPYGVTKLAAEHLCGAYARNFGVRTTSVRYFTVYGPRQRPDMAIHRLVEASLSGSAFTLFGDGSQVRDFTYVGDIVDATFRAGTTDVEPGTVVNAAGGSSITVAELIALVGRAAGREIVLDRRPAQPGDVQATGGSVDLAGELLGWRPIVDVETGVRHQVQWHRERTVGIR